MPEHFDAASLGLYTLFLFALSLFLYLSMDIHNASKVLWNACENLKGKVVHSQPFKRRASDSDFQLLNSPEETSVPSTPEPRDGWSLVSDHKHAYGSADDLSRAVDCGHFSEEEFLARFGGRRSLPTRFLSKHQVHSSYLICFGALTAWLPNLARAFAVLQPHFRIVAVKSIVW